MDADPPVSAAAPADALTAALEQRRGDQGIVVVDAATVQLVVFAIGGRVFALPGAQVVEILPLPVIHFVPGCPPAIEAVIKVRGTIYSVCAWATCWRPPMGR